MDRCDDARRFFSLDGLKAVGMVYLISLHVLVWLMIYDDGAALVYEKGAGVLAAFGRTGAHVLGFGFAVWAGATFLLRWRRSSSRLAQIIVYPVFLMALQILTNVLAWGWSDALAWDVLSFFALSMTLSGLCLELGRVGWVLISAGTVVALWLSETIVPSPSYVSIILLGDPMGHHYWPLCPWYALFGSGMVLGRLLSHRSNRALLVITAVGVVCVLWSIRGGHFLPRLNLPNIWGPSLFKPAKEFVIGIIGANFLLVGALEACRGIASASPEWWRRLIRVVRVISRGVLMMYVCSLIVGYHLVWDVFYELRPWRFEEALAAWPVISLVTFIVSYQAGAWWAAMKAKKAERLS